MQHRVSAWVVAIALAVFSLAVPRTAGAQGNNQGNGNGAAGGLVVPISGTVNSATGSLTGNLRISRFAIQNGVLTAVGTLTATVLDSSGNIVRTIIQPAAIPVASATGSCPVLHLELGPVDLNLLGLAVHLDRIVLDITAQQGPGNLVGNLICQIAGLLDAGTLNNLLTNLLNQLVGLLSGL